MRAELGTIPRILDRISGAFGGLAIVVSPHYAREALQVHRHLPASSGESILSFVSVALWALALGIMIAAKRSRMRVATGKAEARSPKSPRRMKERDVVRRTRLRVARGDRDGG
jgi:hypothetical protein